MRSSDVVFLVLAGVVFWVFGTLYFGRRGAEILERSATRYWIAMSVTSLVSAAICVALLRWRGVPHPQWGTAMLLLAIPGMFGEVLALANMPRLLPGLRIESGGRYGALLFAVYGAVLAIGEIVAMSA